jgi:hypothetical protein
MLLSNTTELSIKLPAVKSKRDKQWGLETLNRWVTVKVLDFTFNLPATVRKIKSTAF